jgi:hypothetical protein
LTGIAFSDRFLARYSPPQPEISYKLPAVPQFTRYRKVFARFGFGQRIEALLLSQIYPLQNYLANGEPEIKICNGRRSGKPTKRYLSLRRFMKALGCAPSHS